MSVGRSVATTAVLCFAAQWAPQLRGVATETGHRSALIVSRLVVPMIAVVEHCLWYAVLTTSNFGHVLEASIWGPCAALLVASLAFAWPRILRRRRPLLALTCVIGLADASGRWVVSGRWADWRSEVLWMSMYFSSAVGLIIGLIRVAGSLAPRPPRPMPAGPAIEPGCVPPQSRPKCSEVRPT